MTSMLKVIEKSSDLLCYVVDFFILNLICISRQQIMGSIRRHKHAMSALLAEYTDKEEMEQQLYLQEITNNKR